MENAEVVVEEQTAVTPSGPSSHLGRPSRIAVELRRRLKSCMSGEQKMPALASRVGIMLELLLLVLWTLFVTRSYLDMNPQVVPSGREYLSAIQTHHFWTRLRECGVCALWSGNIRGGHPALVDPHGSFLHPLVMVTTLIWGVVNGSKLALVAAFLMAGLAQWWLGRELGLGRIARTWSALMAVAAGSLAGRMELGAFGVVLSTAACALVLPAILAVNRSANFRAAVGLGLTLAMAIVAGQGYMQVGLAAMLPAAIALFPSRAGAGLWLPWDKARLAMILRRYALAIGLAVCLAAPFLVPLLHFLPQFVKDLDPKFGSAQPFAYVPLNLVINDHRFYGSDSFSKLPFPHLYVNFVGWVPVLLAIWGLSGHPRAGKAGLRAMAFLVAAAFLAMWVSSAEPLRWIVKVSPIQWLADQVAGVRHPPQIAGLAVPPILGLAGIGLERLLSTYLPRLRLMASLVESLPQRVAAPLLAEDSRPVGPAATTGANTSLAFDLRWLLAIPLILALTVARSFGSQWISTSKLDTGVYQTLAALKTPDLQWVNMPFGDHYWLEAAVGMNLKLASGIQTWNWRDHPYPEPVLEANRQGPPPNMKLKATVAGVPIYAAPAGREYATVTLADGSRSVCTARGSGGNLDVECQAAQAGALTVKENTWPGWQVTVDGRRAVLRPGQWLSVDLPAGNHTVAFRYRPWDVPVGLALCLLGVFTAFYMWFRLATQPEETTV